MSDMNASSDLQRSPRSFGVRLVVEVVEFAGKKPWLVVALATLMLVLTGNYARGIEVRSDLSELLPRDSPAFRAFEHQAGRAGGSSMLIAIVSSPDRAKNERYVDTLAERLAELQKRRPDLVSYVENGTRDVRAYYEANKWLYADVAELERIDADLDHQIAIRSGLVEDLLTDGPGPAAKAERAAPPNGSPPEETASASGQKEALGLGDALSRWKENAAQGLLPHRLLLRA
jgi:hypothetical protein